MAVLVVAVVYSPDHVFFWAKKENNNKSNRWPSWQLFDKDTTADRTLICSATMRKLFACFILSALGNDGLENETE